MCLILESAPLTDIKIEGILLKLLWCDARDYDEFKPFVEFVKKSEWYLGLVEYCKKTKKDIKPYLEKCFMIFPYDLGQVTAVVPLHINKIDIIYKTEKYQVWKECVHKFITKKLES